ncbi:hypothetical protein CLU81_1803 [Flavobacterium sp. 9]|nr:hypothetical protein CLU81_1803 [Flavobacterium sp. 9]
MISTYVILSEVEGAPIGTWASTPLSLTIISHNKATTSLNLKNEYKKTCSKKSRFLKYDIRTLKLPFDNRTCPGKSTTKSSQNNCIS